jgi:hypothetical protein
VELAAASSTCPSGGLTLPAISAVFTITHVAAMLGENEDWLQQLSTDMFPEHGRVYVYGIDEDGSPSSPKTGSSGSRTS